MNSNRCCGSCGDHEPAHCPNCGGQWTESPPMTLENLKAAAAAAGFVGTFVPAKTAARIEELQEFLNQGMNEYWGRDRDRASRDPEAWPYKKERGELSVLLKKYRVNELGPSSCCGYARTPYYGGESSHHCFACTDYVW